MPMTLDEFRSKRSDRGRLLPGVQRCVECNVGLQETVTGNRLTDKGHVCSDCYFSRVSDEVEQFPIFMPRASHGA